MSTGPGADSAPGHTSTTTRASGSAKNSMFSSLKIRNYRLFATGQVVSNTGTWMQRIAQDWLVLSLTGSASAVGITIALQFLPMMLFGLYGGVLADRLPKRPLLLCTQAAMGLTGIALAVLTLMRPRPGLARLPGRLPARTGHRRRQPGPADLRLRDGRQGPGGQRRQSEFGQLPVRAAGGPGAGRCPHHRRRLRLGLPAERPVLRGTDHRPAADAHARTPPGRGPAPRQGPAAGRTALRQPAAPS